MVIPRQGSAQPVGIGIDITVRQGRMNVRFRFSGVAVDSGNQTGTVPVFIHRHIQTDIRPAIIQVKGIVPAGTEFRLVFGSRSFQSHPDAS